MTSVDRKDTPRLLPCPFCKNGGKPYREDGKEMHGISCAVCKANACVSSWQSRAVDDADLAAKHPDDIAVDRFASAMKEKMHKKAKQGRGGWQDKELCTAEYLRQLLMEHIEKGDPVALLQLPATGFNTGEGIIPK